MIYMAIDGASRRNGKEDCLSTGSVFTKFKDNCAIGYGFERRSTNQRGELHALYGALTGAADIINIDGPQDVFIITDSEYILNTMTKDWMFNWRNKGWIKADGQPVANQDIWENILDVTSMLKFNDIDIMTYHVKGHLLSLGKKAKEFLDYDQTGFALYEQFAYLYDNPKLLSQVERIKAAKDKFLANHGFHAQEDAFREMVICNSVADVAASKYADEQDAEWIRGDF